MTFSPLQPSLVRYAPHVNAHSRHVWVSDRVRLCRTRSLSIVLQTRLPIKCRHVKEREVNGSTNNAHSRSEPSNEWPHLQSLCKTYSFLTPRVTLIPIPSTCERSHKKMAAAAALYYDCFSHFASCSLAWFPGGIWRSPVLGELWVSGEELQVATSENLSLSLQINMQAVKAPQAKAIMEIPFNA